MFQVDRAIVESLNRIAQHEPLRLAALGAAGAAGALGLDQLAGHLYFRRRPYWALPTVHPIGPRSGSSSFFSPTPGPRARQRAQHRWT
jgi:hypothetical protein